MGDQLPGELWLHFVTTILLTLVVSQVILAWYRRSVAEAMGTAGAPSTATASWVQDRAPHRNIADPAQQANSEITFAAETALLWRVGVIYGLGAFAAALVMTALFLIALGGAFVAIRAIVILYVFCWPIVPTICLLLVVPRGRTLLACAAYVAAGLLVLVILPAAIQYTLGWAGSISLHNAVSFLQFLAMQAWLPLLIILVTSGRRIRSITPLVLAGLLLFSFGNFAAGYALIAAMDFGAVSNVVLSWGAQVGSTAWYLLAALPTGYVCWRGLRWLSRQYERKAFSDAQLLIDAWWLIIAFNFSLFLIHDFGWLGIVGLSGFAAFRAVDAAGLRLWPFDDARPSNRRHMLLRVFGFQRRTEKLFDIVAQRWRWVGSVRMIAGTDLATRIIAPADLISFVGGRLRQLFVSRDDASLQRLDKLDDLRDPDGRYRVNKLYCHQDSWQPALQHLLAKAEFVLMDLRGFSENNQGCLFELQQIAQQELLGRSIFVVDDTTDSKLVKAVLLERRTPGLAGEYGTQDVNLVYARSA